MIAISRLLVELVARVDGEHQSMVVDQIPPKVIYDIAPTQREELGLLVHTLCGWRSQWTRPQGQH
jgi:hypothetical protein